MFSVCNVRVMIIILIFFFFNDTATTEIYTLSLHDALPISRTTAAGGGGHASATRGGRARGVRRRSAGRADRDRKSTRLNSSHSQISYAVFCLKKKKKTIHAAIATACHAGIVLMRSRPSPGV